MYTSSFTFTKISILLQYLRVFNVTNIRKLCYIQIVIVSVYGVWLFFSSIFNCVPIARNWDKTVQGKCLPTTPLWLTNAALNIATDIMIVLLPMPVISSLTLPLKQKFWLAIVFAFGLMYGIHPITFASSRLIWANTAVVFALFRSSASIRYTLARKQQTRPGTTLVSPSGHPSSWIPLLYAPASRH